MLQIRCSGEKPSLLRHSRAGSTVAPASAWLIDQSANQSESFRAGGRSPRSVHTPRPALHRRMHGLTDGLTVYTHGQVNIHTHACTHARTHRHTHTNTHTNTHTHTRTHKICIQIQNTPHKPTFAFRYIPQNRAMVD